MTGGKITLNRIIDQSRISCHTGNMEQKEMQQKIVEMTVRLAKLEGEFAAYEKVFRLWSKGFEGRIKALEDMHNMENE